mmetsp:Transcript_6700/g.17114  ORF Transcript_6700/g.17114 Transcript_6700/m.17114 type:complete len:295 (+) Transcript_6700:115-999(+)
METPEPTPPPGGASPLSNTVHNNKYPPPAGGGGPLWLEVGDHPPRPSRTHGCSSNHPKLTQLPQGVLQRRVVHEDPPRGLPLDAVGRSPVVDEHGARARPALLVLRVATDDLELPPLPPLPHAPLEPALAPVALLLRRPRLLSLGHPAEHAEGQARRRERLPERLPALHPLEPPKEALLPLARLDPLPHVPQLVLLGRLPPGHRPEASVKVGEHPVEVAVEDLDLGLLASSVVLLQRRCSPSLVPRIVRLRVVGRVVRVGAIGDGRVGPLGPRPLGLAAAVVGLIGLLGHHFGS